jgi:hypothetical protein
MMPQSVDSTYLRDAGFLLWLGKFVGEWELGARADIRRRDDGFLCILSHGRNKTITLGAVIRDGEFVKQAGPLGPYPVAITRDLMKLWLTSALSRRP